MKIRIVSLLGKAGATASALAAQPPLHYGNPQLLIAIET